MFGGIDPKLMKQAMKRMGVKQEEIVVKNPQVVKVNMMGQETFQVSGDIMERSGISDEDVKTVASQAGVSEDAARSALEETSGDLAEAILKLKS